MKDKRMSDEVFKKLGASTCPNIHSAPGACADVYHEALRARENEDELKHLLRRALAQIQGLKEPGIQNDTIGALDR